MHSPLRSLFVSWLSRIGSRMFNPSHYGSSDLRPIDAIIQFLIHQAHNSDVISPNQVQAMHDLARRFRIIWRTDDSFYSL